MASLLDKLACFIDVSKLSHPPTPKVGGLPPPEDGTAITHAWLWNRLGAFLQPSDVVLADTGTATYGFPDIRFPADVKYIAQSYYMSIGFTAPAAVGADIASEELYRAGKVQRRGRTVLNIGDGSLMLTLQEVGTMVMKSLPILM